MKKKLSVTLRDFVVQEEEILLCGLQMIEDLPYRMDKECLGNYSICFLPMYKTLDATIIIT